MYTENIPYLERNLQMPIGMMNRLNKMNQSRLGRAIHTLVGVILFSTLIGSCGYESFVKPFKQSGIIQECVETPKKFLEYISQDF